MNIEKNRNLSQDDIYRYSRQIVLPEIGIEGQKKIKQAAVLLVGVGGLGSVQALYLAAAGVGRIGLIDDDAVDISNLQRQVIYATSDTGVSKVTVLEKKLHELNPNVGIDIYNERLGVENAERIVKEYDLVIDGSDNFSTRYLINDVCVFLKKPVIYGSIYRFDGQVSIFDSKSGPCYRCLYPDPPAAGEVANCVIGGVIGTLPGIIGQIQATEAIKFICGIGTSLVGNLLLLNILDWDVQRIKINKNPDCPVCGNNPNITSLINYEDFCGEQEIILPQEWEISAPELSGLITTDKQLQLIDVRESQEIMICNIAHAKLIPEREMMKSPDRFNTNDRLILFCRSGIRSARVVTFLRQQGFADVRNLRGGILAWIDEVDSTLARY